MQAEGLKLRYPAASRVVEWARDGARIQYAKTEDGVSIAFSTMGEVRHL